MTTLDSLISFLNDNKIYPITSENWSSFKLLHQEPSSEEEKQEQHEYIKNQVEDASGIYIYMQNRKCLYIGKGKPLFNRLKSHFRESYIPPGKKDGKWNSFFMHYAGEIEIFWKSFELEDERVIFEMILTQLLKPLFKEYKYNG